MDSALYIIIETVKRCKGINLLRNRLPIKNSSQMHVATKIFASFTFVAFRLLGFVEHAYKEQHLCLHNLVGPN